MGTLLRTRDETLVHGISAQRLATKKFKSQPSAGKLMATVFWDASGVIHIDFLERGATINSECYITTLRTLQWHLKRFRKEMRNAVLQHDNARPHTSRATMAVWRPHFSL